MNNTRTRLLSLVLAMLMVLSLLPTTALAQGSFSYTVDGTTTYVATLKEAVTAANGYLAHGKNVTVDLYADETALTAALVITAKGQTATLTVNMNGHTIESTQGLFRVGYGTGTETASNITLIINGGSGAAGDLTRGTLVFGKGTGEVNKNGIDCYGNSSTITVNYVDYSRGVDSTTSSSRPCFLISTYTVGSAPVLNLNHCTVTDRNTNEGGNKPAILVSTSSTGTSFNATVNIADSTVTSECVSGTVKTNSADTNTTVNILDGSSVIGHPREYKIFTEDIWVNPPAGYGKKTVKTAEGFQTCFIPETLTREQKQRILAQTALAYYYHNPYVQYDGNELTADATIERHEDWASPEDAALDSQIYSVCSNFVYKSYYDAFGYKILGLNYAQTRKYVTLPEGHPMIVYQYRGNGGETDIDVFMETSRKLLQPGDIIATHNGEDGAGHTMLYVGDCLGDGTEYILHCWGKSHDEETGEEKTEPAGSIKLQPVDTCCYAEGPSPNWYLPKASDLGIAILRPFQSWEFPAECTSNGTGRLEYPYLNITRELDRNRFAGVLTGEEIPVTLTIANEGTQPLTDIPVEEYLPEGQTLVAGSASSGVQQDGITLRWSVDIPAGKSVSLTYKVKISGKLGDKIIFPKGLVGGIASRETFLVITEEDLTQQQQTAIYNYGANGLTWSFRDLDFFNQFYRNALGLELYLPATTQELLTKLTYLGEDGNLFRKETIAVEDEALDTMILPLHFTGKQVVNDGSTWSRVPNYNQVFYKPGDLFIGLKGDNVTSVVDTADIDLMVYLGNGKVLLHNAASGGTVQNFDTAFKFALGYHVLIGLRPTNTDEIGHTGEGPHKITVTPSANGTITTTPSGEVITGKKLLVEIVPNDGYILKQLTVNGSVVAGIGTTRYAFVPTGDVTIAGEFMPAVIRVAGYTPENGTQTLYYADLRLTEADTENHYYPSVEQAFIAAKNAWNATGTGTVDIYTDISIDTVDAYHELGIFNTPTECEKVSLILNLNGNTIQADNDIPGTLIRIEKTAATRNITVNDGQLLWDADRGVLYEGYFKGATTNITFSNVDITRNNGGRSPANGHIFAPNTPNVNITVNGGTWELKNGTIPYKIARVGGSNTVFYFTGGVVIKSAATNLITADADMTPGIHVYADDATLYTAADDVAIEGDGKGIIGYGTPVVHWSDPDQTAASNMTVGEATEYCGVTVRPLTVKPLYQVTIHELENGTLTVTPGEVVEEGTLITITPTPDEWYTLEAVTVNGEILEPVEGIYTYQVLSDTQIGATFTKVQSQKIAGYTPENGAEILYYYNEGIFTDHEAVNTYTSLEKAFIAAKNAWNATGTGTVDIYTDISIDTVDAYHELGIFNTPTECGVVSLTLNLHGNTIQADNDIPGTLIRIEKTAATRNITVNDGKLLWDADRGVLYEGYFKGAETNITFNNVDIIRDNGGRSPANGHIFAPNTPNVNITVNGGTWELKNGTIPYKVARVGGSNTVFYLTGGVVIKSTAPNLLTADADQTPGIHVYADNATLYTAADDAAIAGDGKGIIGYGTPVVRWQNPTGTTTSHMTLGEAEEYCGVTVRPLTVEPLCLVTLEEISNGTVTVTPTGAVEAGTVITITPTPSEWYALEAVTVNGEALDPVNGIYTYEVLSNTVIGATFTKAQSQKIAGYTSENGTEILYYYNEAIFEDHEDENTYTSIEKAFIAAKNAWNATATGTVDIYTDIFIETVAAYHETGIFNTPTDCDTVSLTLNLNGNTIQADSDIPGTLIRIEKTAATRNITVNDGQLLWDADRGVFYEGYFKGAETNITFNNVDITRNNGGRSPANGHIFAPNTPNTKITVNGGTWELKNGTIPYKIARVGGSNTVFYLTGGVVIKSTAPNLITADADQTPGIYVYADDATLYTAADDATIEGDGKGIIGYGTPVVRWSNPQETSTAKMTLGEATEYCGVTVRPLMIETYVPTVVQPTLILKYPALTFKDVITMNVFFQAENLGDVVEMGLITYKSQVTEWNVENAEAVIPGYALDETTGFYTVSTEGIAAKDMGDEYWFAVYAKLSDGGYTYTRLVSYSPTTYAYNQLNDPNMSQLVVAMLNYGAAAQVYFDYRTDSLMNAGLTEAQQASVETYRPDMMNGISTVTQEKAANFTRTATGFANRYPTITFDGAFCIDYFCQPNQSVSGDITLYYWDQTAYDACDVLTTENATGALTMVSNGGSYKTSVAGIAAKDLDKGIYVAFVYTDGTETYCSGILGYSIGVYCTGLASGADTMAPFASATAVYGYYAKQVFA